jgi:hypothetical protein
MHVHELPLECIDFGSERYRISETLELAVLQASIREIGQLNPVLLAENERGRKEIVCGFRRLHAIRALGRTSILIRALPSSVRSPLEIFRLALWDNLSHRTLNALEKARGLHVLKNTCGVEPDVLVQSYLPLLELPPHKNVLRSYLALHEMQPALKGHLLDGRLTLSSAERLSRKSLQEQRFLAGVFEKARWSASLQRRFLDLVAELAAVEGCAEMEVFVDPRLPAILDDTRLTPYQRGEQLCAALYQRKNPRLSSTERRFREEREKLALPGDIRLTPDPFFETRCLRVEFEASTSERFREIAISLHTAAQTRALEDLFEKI